MAEGKATPPTSYEQGIAEDYLSVLDYVSRVAQGIEGGDWFYLQDKLRQLSRAADQLRSRIWDDDEHALDATDEQGRAPRAIAVVAIVQRHAHHYRAARALYPQHMSAGGAGRGGN